MAAINVNLNSLIVLLEFLGFELNFEPGSHGVLNHSDKEISLTNKKYVIKLSQLQDSSGDQRELLAIPKLKDHSKKLVVDKLSSIFDLISNDSIAKINSTEICALRRGSSINVSQSFSVNHNVVVNLETSDICTSPSGRCSSPVVSRFGQTSARASRNTFSDLLFKMRNLVDLAIDMSTKYKVDAVELGLNSTFTKDHTAEQSRMESPRISNISKVSPLADIKSEDAETMHSDNVMPFLDVTNKSIACHLSAPKKLSNALNKLVAEKTETESMEKKWKRPFTKIGILKQPSKANGVTSIRNSPIGRFKENHIDTPRPFGASRSSSTSSLSSPYSRPIPRGTTTNSSNNTPSPRYFRAQESTKATPGLRRPGWCTKK